MKTTGKDEVEGYFNFKKIIDNVIYTFFYSNIYEFTGNLEGIIYEGVHRRTVKNMHKIGLNDNNFKSDDVSMLGHGCGVSQFSRLYGIIKNKYKYYCIHVWEVMRVKRVTFFLKKDVL